MAIFPGAGEENILAWRGISALAEEIRTRKAERIAHLHHQEGIDFLGNFRDRLEEELAFEKEFAGNVAEALEQLVAAGSEELLASLLTRLDRLARQYFIRRGSVIALQGLCTNYRDAVLGRALQHVEAELEQKGHGSRPAPYCWIAGGSTGRKEQTLCCDPSWFVIHGDLPAPDAGWFLKFAERSVELLERIGLVREGGHKPLKRAFRLCSRSEWRQEVAEELLQDEPRLLIELVRRADLRPVWGDTGLAEEAIGTVRNVLHFREDMRGARALQMLGKSVAEMPTGVDFFSRLRLERSGRNRGKFNLERFALDPLLSNVRMLAINCGLHETDTIGRIKALQEQGRLSVELTERLLLAWHDFMVFKIARQLGEGCEKESDCFIDPPESDTSDDLRLRSGLEAVAGLEKIAYLCFAEHG